MSTWNCGGHATFNFVVTLHLKHWPSCSYIQYVTIRDAFQSLGSWSECHNTTKTKTYTSHMFLSVLCWQHSRHFNIYLIWSRFSDFSVWCRPKLQVWNLPWTKKDGLIPDQTEPFSLFLVWKHFLDGSDFQTNHRKLWQDIIRGRKKENWGTETRWAAGGGQEESRCLIGFFKESAGKKKNCRQFSVVDSLWCCCW